MESFTELVDVPAGEGDLIFRKLDDGYYLYFHDQLVAYVAHKSDIGFLNKATVRALS